MSLIDAAFPLVAGILMVACPQILFKKGPKDSDQDYETKKDKCRSWGYLLLVIGTIAAAMALLRPR